MISERLQCPNCWINPLLFSNSFTCADRPQRRLLHWWGLCMLCFICSTVVICWLIFTYDVVVAILGLILAAICCVDVSLWSCSGDVFCIGFCCHSQFFFLSPCASFWIYSMWQVPPVCWSSVLLLSGGPPCPCSCVDLLLLVVLRGSSSGSGPIFPLLC